MIAYIVLAHNKMTQLERLIKKINYKDNYIIIHIDKKVDKKQFNNIKNKFSPYKNIIFLDKRFNCIWGDFSIVKATNYCIKHLINSKKDFTHAILLSGMDFPIKSNEYIEEYFKENKNIDFIQCSNNSIYEDNSKFNIYYFKFANLFKNIRLQKLAFRVQYKLSYFLNIKREHPLFNRVFFGSQWWVLSKTTLMELNKFIFKNKRYIKFYKNTNIPDEFFFQTLVGNLSKNNVVNKNLHYMEWEKDAWHPNTFKMKDIDKISKATKLFARKFDQDIDNNIIDYLERTL